jgi:hypothetical protein
MRQVVQKRFYCRADRTLAKSVHSYLAVLLDACRCGHLGHDVTKNVLVDVVVRRIHFVGCLLQHLDA